MALVYRSWLVALLLPQLLQAGTKEKPTSPTPCSWERGKIELTGTGFVTVCDGGIVKLICDADWTVEDAEVVCRTLGLPTAGAQNGTFSQSSIAYNKTLLVPDCEGTEANLTECKWSNKSLSSDCENFLVAVNCSNSLVSPTSIATATSTSTATATPLFNPTTSQFAVPPQTISSSISVPSSLPSVPSTISTTDAGLIAAGCVLFLFIFLILVITVALVIICRRRHRKNCTMSIENIPNPLFNEPVYLDPLDSVSIKLTSPVTGVPPPGPLYHTVNPTKPTKPVTDTEGIYSEVQDIIRTKTLPASMMNRPLPPPITSRSSSTLPPHVCKRGPENVSASATAISEAAAPYELPATSSRGRSISDGSRQSEQQRDLYASLDESRQYATLEPYMGQSQTPQASEAPRVPCSNEEGTYAHLNHQATPPSTPGSASDATSTNSEGEHAKLMDKDSQHRHSTKETKETKEELGSWW